MKQQLTRRMRIVDGKLLEEKDVGLREFIVEQVNAGTSLKDVAEELGISRWALDNWILRLGIRKERKLTITGA